MITIIFEGAWTAKYNDSKEWRLFKGSEAVGIITADEGTVVLNDKYCHDIRDLQNLCKLINKVVKEFNNRTKLLELSEKQELIKKMIG